MLFIILCIPLIILTVLFILGKKYPRVRAWFWGLLYFLHLIPLYPCIYLTFTRIIRHDPLHWVWSHDFLGATLLIILARCFFLPYIVSALLSGAYIYHLEKENYPKVEKILFGIMLILCIMGLFSVEAVFDAGMGI